MLCLNTNAASPNTIKNHYQWNPPKRNRTDLYCPLRPCKNVPDVNNNDITGSSEISCCNCRSIPYWELIGNETSFPVVEYTTRRGHAQLVLNENQSLPYQVVIHTNGELTAIPDNKCLFSGIVEIDFSRNAILDVGDISCLEMLDTLNLSRNKIKYISNKTFAGLEYLRNVDFSYNEIKSIQVNTLSRPEVGLFRANFDYNNMETVDVSNFVIEKSFCSITYNHNNLNGLINDGNLTLDTNKTYGRGGYVSFTENNFTTFPDLKKLGVNDLTLLGKIMHYGFDFRGSPWHCDGHMVPYLMLAEDIVRALWRDYMDIMCHQPPLFQNKTVRSLLQDKKLDEFISELTPDEACPFKCTCIEQPSKYRTFVNCSHAQLTELPKEMPSSNSLEIDLSFNKIRTLLPRKYISRIRKLTLSSNDIVDVSEHFLKLLISRSVQLQLDDNKDFRTLNRRFQDMSPCDVYFGNMTIDCECKDAWIGGWLKSESCEARKRPGHLTCENDKLGRFPAEDITESVICEPDNTIFRILTIIFSVLILIMAGVSSFAYTYRYEIFLFLKRYKDWDLDAMCLFKYDAYISMNDNNEELRRWTCQRLIPELRRSGFSIYCPCQNAEVGCSLDEEVIMKMNTCRHVIIMLSSDYLAPTEEDCNYLHTTLEWRHAWNLFRRSDRMRLIIINYDQVRTVDIEKRQLQAFVRLRETLDFSNRNHSLLDEVRHRLGIPWRNTGLKNAKPRYFQISI